MARVPVSFYLNIIAGLFVLFHHSASSETGDVAFNKITGAAGRFATLFYDTTARFGSVLSRPDASGLGEPRLDGWEVAGAVPRDTAENFRMHCCSNSGDGDVGDTQDVLRTRKDDERAQHQHEFQPSSRGGGGYGGSGSAYVYAWAYHQQPSMRLVASSPPPFVSHPDAEILGHWQTDARHHHASTTGMAIWDRLHEAAATIGAILGRTYAAHWWFRAPLHATGALLFAYSVLSVLGGGSLQFYGITLSQVYVMAMVDFLQCIQWEAQRRLLSDAGVAGTMELIRSVIKFSRTRMQGLVGP